MTMKTNFLPFSSSSVVLFPISFLMSSFNVPISSNIIMNPIKSPLHFFLGLYASPFHKQLLIDLHYAAETTFFLSVGLKICILLLIHKRRYTNIYFVASLRRSCWTCNWSSSIWSCVYEGVLSNNSQIRIGFIRLLI